MKLSKRESMLSGRDTLRAMLQAEEEVLRRCLSALLAADSRSLRAELLPLFSSALEDRAALQELLHRSSPEDAGGPRRRSRLPRRRRRSFVPFPKKRVQICDGSGEICAVQTARGVL